MKIVIQRVRSASVSVGGNETGRCGYGVMVLVGVGHDSTERDAVWLAKKTTGLRIFDDDHGRMNLALGDIDGGVLAISQFTLYGDAQKGRRPSFTAAANPDKADRLYDRYCDELETAGVPVGRGVFGAHMSIDAALDGPVTITVQSTGR